MKSFDLKRRAVTKIARQLVFLLAALGVCLPTTGVVAQTISATVNVNGTLTQMPEYGMGIHTSVYDNSLRASGSPVFNQLNGMLDAAGVDVLRYPGGGYADVFHFSVSRPGGLTGFGLSPWWGNPAGYGYMGPQTDFGSFVKLLDATQSKTVITVNTGSAIKYDGNKLAVPTHNGQPQEAAAWVAYANGDASLFGTAGDVSLGVDAEGNDWKTAGYWAKLRTSTAAEFSTWAGAAGLYDSRNAFLAIDRDAPVGIKYWEIGNENFGTGYYGGAAGDTGYALNYAAPYDGTARDDNPLLSPAAYGQEVNAFAAAMRAVDPTIKIGAVLATPPGDYSWSYADLNDNGSKQANEPYWNDEVLSQTANNIDFAIVHWYPNGNATTIVNAPRTTIPVMINGTTAGIDTGSSAGLRDSIATWRTDHNPNALEIFVTETDGGGTSQTVDGLFAADTYATFFENGVSNVDWLELHQGGFLQDSTNAPDYAYWGIQSVHLLAEAGDRLLSTATGEAAVRVHAAAQADGTIAVMVINTNTSSRTVNVSINGDPLSADGVMYQTNGDTALAMTSLTTLGNAFSTTIAGRNLQLFLIPPAPLLPLLGDYNLDNKVDADDLVAWNGQVGQEGVGLAADGNGDGIVDGADLAIWQQNLGNARAVPASAAVPEPAGGILAACGMLAYAAGRRSTI